MKRSLRYLLPLALFALLAGVLARGLRLDPHEVPSPLIGKPAPGFTLPQVDTTLGPLRRDDLLGQVWVLNVWASWCVACRDEHPTLLAFAKQRRVPLIGLAYKDTRDDAAAWLARTGNPYRATPLDADGRTGIDYGVYGVPETFVIDRQGVVRLKVTGPLTAQTIVERIEPMLKRLEG
jgi:cytochrome c biogenesis protein CcmG/thiol:disulfide interchange protein DsbE